MKTLNNNEIKSLSQDLQNAINTILVAIAAVDFSQEYHIADTQENNEAEQLLKSNNLYIIENQVISM